MHWFFKKSLQIAYLAKTLAIKMNMFWKNGVNRLLDKNERLNLVGKFVNLVQKHLNLVQKHVNLVQKHVNLVQKHVNLVINNINLVTCKNRT